jgi:hypothetical protein
MDPRLWQLLEMPPADLYIRRVWLSHEGSTLTLECEAVCKDYPDGRVFQIAFQHCRDIHWQSVGPVNGNVTPQALGMYLGERDHNKPAVVYTGDTEMTVLYHDVMVQTA